jgi:hypothetical protein
MNRTGCDVDHAELVLEIELKKAVVPRRERMVLLIAAHGGRSNSKMIDECAQPGNRSPRPELHRRLKMIACA